MKISFHGACREVTGSCALIETKSSRFLLDCGMFQGKEYGLNRNYEDFTFDPKTIDFVLLSHAHIDHCGRLPKLYKDGFRGKIYCTAATADLTKLMLEDSAKIIHYEAAEIGKDPFYSLDDVEETIKLMHPLPYSKEVIISGNVKVILKNAGHILGSCFYEIFIKEKGLQKKVIFSGDLGNSPARIIRDLEKADGADIVIVESTYAGVQHESKEDGKKIIRRAIMECIKNKGVLMVPIFALEKVQEILFELNDLVENKKIPYVPIFLDSPLAIKTTEVYKKYEYLYDKESLKLIVAGDDLFDFPGLEFTLTSDESKKINTSPVPKVILAGGGMCNGGRIIYHLKFNLDKPQNQVLLVAYQVKGSLGRKLFDEQKIIKVDNINIKVKAKTSVVNSYSAHADHNAIMGWLKKIKNPKPKHIFVIHGEEESNEILAQDISKKIRTHPIVPEYGQVYEF